MNSTNVTAPSMLDVDSSALTIYTLPDFTQALEQTLTDCLRLSHRGLAFDYARARLVCQERSIEPGATEVTSSYPLLASLTAHFTGLFQWQNVESAGLYATEFPLSDTPSIGGLDRDALIALYAAVAQALPDRYKQTLSDHWAEVQPSGKTRREDFLADRVKLLRLEGQMRVAKGEFRPHLYSMLDATLDYGMDTSADPLQKHDVFNLWLGTHSTALFPLTGAFVITEQRSDQVPATDDESVGEVVLYTPASSLERFDSVNQLTDTLTRRLADETQRRQLLGHLRLNDVITMALPNADVEQPPVRWGLQKLGNNFMSLLLTSQIIKQKADFDHAVNIAQSLNLNQPSLQRLILELMASDQLFDNHRIERQLDCDVVREQMPDWWDKMSEEQRAEWTRDATAYAQSIRAIRRISLEHFNTPQADGAHVLTAYVDATVTAALAEKNIQLAPRQIQVIATFPHLNASLFYPLTPTETTTRSQTHSLHAVAHKDALRTTIQYASDIRAADEHGAAIPGLSGVFVKELLARIQIPKRLDDYLAEHLDHSEYAAQLKHNHRELLLARLGMAYAESQLNGFPENRLRWIKAVLDGPDSQQRTEVEELSIEVRMLHISGVMIPDVMLIAPVGKFSKGPLVLCTLNAPDNVVFRAFDSMFHLTQAFLERDTYKSYMARLLPLADRGQARLMLDYEESLKHWRLPDVLASLPNPVPIPSHFTHPVVFVTQTGDLFDDYFGVRIRQLKEEAKSLLIQPDTGESRWQTFDMVVSVALLLLPPPVMIPLALGMGLANAWSGFQKVDENDWDGAAQEFMDAAGYLLTAGVSRAGGAAFKGRQLAAIKRPHLVRRIGRHGQVQIGYLLSPAGAPYFTESGMITRLDPKKFTEITLDSEKAYVARRFNLFGRCRLYRTYYRDPALLIHEDEYVVRTRTGGWRKVSQPVVRLAPSASRQARHDLSLLLTGWPFPSEGISIAEPSLDEPRFLALAERARAELYPELLDYIEGGSAEINQLLRSGARTPRTQAFLNQFYRLRSWKGDAFRAARVTNEGLQQLRRELGAVFVDSGVQSASISRGNAVRWSLDRFVTDQASSNTHPVFLIFAPSVPKKNMFSDFLADHVAIPPGTRLQIRAFEEVNGQAFAYFTAPDNIAYETFDLFTGERELFVR
ncbi:dermonecrotic toxin domain-containing protein [Pseudomonas sp. AK106]